MVGYDGNVLEYGHTDCTVYRKLLGDLDIVRSAYNTDDVLLAQCAESSDHLRGC